MDSNVFDVIIVGAGLAGLSAAVTFIDANITNILILEAQHQIGGRVRTESIGDGFVFDYGAQWIHGKEGNSIYEFARERGLLSNDPSFEGEGLYLTQNGETVDSALVDEVSEKVDEALDNILLLNDPSTSNIDAVFRNVERQLTAAKSVDHLLQSRLVDWHRKYQLIDNACTSLEHLAIDAWSEFNECPGNYCQLVENGFSSVVEVLQKRIPQGSIRCNEPVRRIVWKGESEDDNVHIETSNGETFQCHHVIVTCSAGYLQRNSREMFKPSLPEEWHSAFDAIGFGTITKILLVFQKPFWDDQCRGFQFIWTDDNVEEEGVPSWYRFLTGFDVVQSSSSAALLGWVGGEGAASLDADNTITNEILGEECVRLLQQFTGLTNIPTPCKTFRSRWSTNQYVLGAYSYRRAPFDASLIDPGKTLSDGACRRPALLFAGEAFHQNHYSTTHGAFESGRDQASRIVNWRSDQKLIPIS